MAFSEVDRTREYTTGSVSDTIKAIEIKGLGCIVKHIIHGDRDIASVFNTLFIPGCCIKDGKLVKIEEPVQADEEGPCCDRVTCTGCYTKVNRPPLNMENNDYTNHR